MFQEEQLHRLAEELLQRPAKEPLLQVGAPLPEAKEAPPKKKTIEKDNPTELDKQIEQARAQLNALLGQQAHQQASRGAPPEGEFYLCHSHAILMYKCFEHHRWFETLLHRCFER